MQKQKEILVLVLSLLFTYAMLFYTFYEEAIFWYLYAFTLLVGTAIALIFTQLEDQLPTWQYLVYGIGYGTITYGFVWLGSKLLPMVDAEATKSVETFLTTYGPTNIWHYLMLIFIIVIGEEIFWRGYVQQKLKQFSSTKWAVFVTALLFSVSLAISGFLPGALAAFIAGLIFGTLYEWKKSLPLLIVAHLVFVLLLFLVLPLV